MLVAYIKCVYYQFEYSAYNHTSCHSSVIHQNARPCVKTRHLPTTKVHPGVRTARELETKLQATKYQPIVTK